MRKSTLVRLILFAILAVVLVGILIAGIGFKYYFSFTNAKYEKLEAAVQPVSGGTENVIQGIIPASIDDIRVSWVSGSITLDTADIGEITITETGKDIGEHTMVLQHTDSRLMVLYQDDAVGRNFLSSLFKAGNLPEKNLHITVPTGWKGKVLVVDSVSTLLAVNNVEIEEAKVNGASGDSIFRDCRIGKLKMENATCDLSFDGCLHELKLEGVSAAANVILLNNPDSIQVESVSSELNLTLPEDCGFTVKKDGLGGSFSSDFDTKADKNNHVHGDGHCIIDLDGVSPSVKIQNSHKAAIAW